MAVYLRKKQQGTPAEAYFNKHKNALDEASKGRRGGRVGVNDLPRKSKARAALQRASKKGTNAKAISSYIKGHKGKTAKESKAALTDLYSFSVKDGGEPHTR